MPLNKVELERRVEELEEQLTYAREEQKQQQLTASERLEKERSNYAVVQEKADSKKR